MDKQLFLFSLVVYSKDLQGKEILEATPFLFFVVFRIFDAPLYRVVNEIVTNMNKINSKVSLVIFKVVMHNQAIRYRKKVTPEELFQILTPGPFFLKNLNLKCFAPLHPSMEDVTNHRNITLYFIQACSRKDIWGTVGPNKYACEPQCVGNMFLKIAFFVEYGKEVEYCFRYQTKVWSQPFRLIETNKLLNQLFTTSNIKPEPDLASWSLMVIFENWCQIFKCNKRLRKYMRVNRQILNNHKICYSTWRLFERCNCGCRDDIKCIRRNRTMEHKELYPCRYV